ncbi:MAG: ATP-dependent protease subunit HslV [Bacillota bacterium]
MMQGTTIIALRKNGKTAIAGDGQVTFGNNMIMKQKARKVRKLYNNQVLAGFAGSVSDALTLFEKFEGKLQEYRGNLQRAAIELGKEWRSDRVLRRLEALLIVADENSLLIISGNGEIIEPDDQIAAIGSGGGFALAAGRALLKYSDLQAEEVVKEALLIASSICIYTNDQIVVETF